MEFVLGQIKYTNWHRSDYFFRIIIYHNIISILVVFFFFFIYLFYFSFFRRIVILNRPRANTTATNFRRYSVRGGKVVERGSWWTHLYILRKHRVSRYRLYAPIGFYRSRDRWNYTEVYNIRTRTWPLLLLSAYRVGSYYPSATVDTTRAPENST